MASSLCLERIDADALPGAMPAVRAEVPDGRPVSAAAVGEPDEPAAALPQPGADGTAHPATERTARRPTRCGVPDDPERVLGELLHE